MFMSATVSRSFQEGINTYGVVVASNGIAFMQNSVKFGLIVKKKHNYVIRLYFFGGGEKSRMKLQIFKYLSEFKRRCSHFHFHHLICLTTTASVV